MRKPAQNSVPMLCVRYGSILPTIFLLAVSGAAMMQAPVARAADECLEAPNGPTPPGGHWYYRTDHAKQRKCWYLGQSPQNAQAATAAQDESQSSATRPAKPETRRAERPAASRAAHHAASRQTKTPTAPAAHPDSAPESDATLRMRLYGEDATDAATPAVISPTAPLSAQANGSQQPDTESVSPPKIVTAPAGPAPAEISSPATPDRVAPEPVQMVQDSVAPADVPAQAAADASSKPAEPPVAVRMALLLGAAFAISGLLVHATYTIVSARRRRIHIDRRHADWEIDWDVGAEPARLPRLAPPSRASELTHHGLRPSDAHEDVEETLRKILQACGHRAA
jgi:hypothetical protein